MNSANCNMYYQKYLLRLK